MSTYKFRVGLALGCFIFSSACFVSDDYSEPPAKLKCRWGETADGVCDDPVGIVAGDAHTCVIRGQRGGSQNTAWCWGDNQFGQLGINDDFNAPFSHIPKRVFGLSSVSDLSAGASHTCAIDNGKVYCWGANLFGQLGHDPSVNNGFTRKPVLVPGTDGTKWARVYAGGKHTCALSESAEVWCWGDSTYGQSGKKSNSPTLWRPPEKLPMVDATRMSLGSNHTCAGQDDFVSCWGQASSGKTLRNETVSQSQWHIPQLYSFSSGISGLSLGREHTCALIDELVACWGSNSDGQLGLATGAPIAQSEPYVLPTPASVKAVATGGLSTCALLKSGSVYCWGNNDSAQLGDDSFDSRHEPKIIGGDDSEGDFLAEQLAVGSEHACVIDRQGDIRCWGLNNAGQSGQAIGGEDSSTQGQRRRTVSGPSLIEPPPPPDEDQGAESRMVDLETPVFNDVQELCLTGLGTNFIRAPNSVSPPNLEVDTATNADQVLIPLLVESCGNVDIEISTELAMLSDGFSQVLTSTMPSIVLRPGEKFEFVLTHTVPQTDKRSTTDELVYRTSFPIQDAAETEIHKIEISRIYTPEFWADVFIDDSMTAADFTQTVQFTEQIPRSFRVVSNWQINDVALNNDNGDDFEVTSSTAQDKEKTIVLRAGDGGGDRSATLVIQFRRDSATKTATLTLFRQSSIGLTMSDFIPKKIASGHAHSCVLGELASNPEEQQVQCWGSLWNDAVGGLVNESTPQKIDISLIKQPTSRSALYKIRDIFAGGNKTCVTSEPVTGNRDDLRVHCWGDNEGNVFSTESHADLDFNLRDTSNALDSTVKITDIVVDEDGEQYIVGNFQGEITLKGMPQNANQATGFLINRHIDQGRGAVDWFVIFRSSFAHEAFLPTSIALGGDHVVVGGNVAGGVNGGPVTLGPAVGTGGQTSSDCTFGGGPYNNNDLRPNSNNAVLAQFKKDGTRCEVSVLLDKFDDAGFPMAISPSGVFLEDLVVDRSGLSHALYAVGYVHNNADLLGNIYEIPVRQNQNQDEQEASGFVMAIEKTPEISQINTSSVTAVFFNSDPSWGDPMLNSTDMPTKFSSVAVLRDVASSTPTVVVAGIGIGCLYVEDRQNGVRRKVSMSCQDSSAQFQERAHIVAITEPMNAGLRNFSSLGVQLNYHEKISLTNGTAQYETLAARVVVDDPSASFPRVFLAVSGYGNFERNQVSASPANLYKGYGLYLESIIFQNNSLDFPTDGRRFIKFQADPITGNNLYLSDLAYDSHTQRIIVTGDFFGEDFDFTTTGGRIVSASSSGNRNHFLAEFDEDWVLQRDVLATDTPRSSGNFFGPKLATKYSTTSTPSNGVYAAGHFSGTFQFGLDDTGRTVTSAAGSNGTDGFTIHFPPRASGSEKPLQFDANDNTSSILDFGLGRAHACWLRETQGSMPQRILECWGDARYNKTLENKATVNGPGFRPKPVDWPLVSIPTTISALTVGDEYSCAKTFVDNAMAIQCWGSCASRQCFTSQSLGISSPMLPDESFGGDVVEGLGADLTSSKLGSKAFTHACLFENSASQGVAECWGNWDCGQLGYSSDSTLSNNDHVISDAFMGTQILDIQAGRGFSCRSESSTMMSMETEPKISCWGRQDLRGIGESSGCMMDPTPSSPVAVKDINNRVLSCVRDFAVGENHTCAIGQISGSGLSVDCGEADRDYVFCWGEGSEGQIGDGRELIPQTNSIQTTAKRIQLSFQE